MRVPLAMLGGAVACVVGAAIWTAITYYTNYEIGWVAWGIGALAGIGVFVGSGKRGDFALGVLAVLFAIAGILLGKFGVVYAIMQDMTEAQGMQVTSDQITEAFMTSFTAFDGLWAILAVFSAFKIASASDEDAAAAESPPAPR